MYPRNRNICPRLQNLRSRKWNLFLRLISQTTIIRHFKDVKYEFVFTSSDVKQSCCYQKIHNSIFILHAAGGWHQHRNCHTKAFVEAGKCKKQCLKQNGPIIWKQITLEKQQNDRKAEKSTQRISSELTNASQKVHLYRIILEKANRKSNHKPQVTKLDVNSLTFKSDLNSIVYSNYKNIKPPLNQPKKVSNKLTITQDDVSENIQWHHINSLC